ncbi:hypothetical protein [Stutzerimonas nitrititolerans]|uniref:hypothetical protein n=1 Tax=Stutzerimonas nitrititolerans TaxID=2482751 RepID=UPI0028990048|nr:hypothetical protein [Stutzerimonas nitrititolerans]
MNISATTGYFSSATYSRTGSAPNNGPVSEPNTPARAGWGAEKPGIQVTLSEGARRSASGELPGWVKEKAEDLRNNPNQAEAMDFVQSMATVPGGALLSYGPNSDGFSDVYYAATGLPVTPENKARYEALSQSITANTTAIFEAERAKGASAADIFEKMHAYMATQPTDYLEATEWYRSSYARG